MYLSNWYNIKVNHSWVEVEGPRHILYQLELLRSQKKVVLNTVMPTLRSAWYAHTEAVLQAMLCSEVEVERRKAMDRILELRGLER